MLSVDDVSRLSGLTRAQLNQAVSRWGIKPHARQKPGSGRLYTPADAFAMCVAGDLHRMGLIWPAIREVVWAATVMAEVNPTTFEQRETFPGASRFTDAILVIRNFDPDALPEAAFIERADLVKVAGDAAIILPASKIANRIVAETETSAR